MTYHAARHTDTTSSETIGRTLCRLTQGGSPETLSALISGPKAQLTSRIMYNMLALRSIQVQQQGRRKTRADNATRWFNENSPKTLSVENTDNLTELIQSPRRYSGPALSL